MTRPWRIDAAVLIVCAACAVERPGIDPPDHRFYFPAGLALDPGGRFLYVTNSNSDLRYNSGTLLAVDLARLPPLHSLDGGSCSCEVDPTAVLGHVCDEECLVADAVRIGDFANDVKIRDAGDRAYVTVRSNPRSLVWVDIATASDPVFSCGEQRLGDKRCRGEHVVEHLSVDEGVDPVELPAEPYGIYLQEGAGLSTRLFVTHLSTGEVTVLDDCGDEVLALHTSEQLFPSDTQGRRGAFALAPRQPTETGGWLYVTSRTAAEVALVTIEPPESRCGEKTFLVAAGTFPLPGLRDGSDARGIVFSGDGTRAFIVDREPPSLVEIDTSLRDGAPQNRLRRVVEVCADPSVVRMDPLLPSPTLFVVCFGTSQVFVVDGDLMQVDSVISTGRGPNDLLFDAERRQAYVALFGENTIGVIDLDATSATYRKMVRRIGLPEPLR